MVQEELRVLHLHLKAASRILAKMRVLKPTLRVIHLLQQGHTYSNRATPLNSVTPFAKHIQTITHGRMRELHSLARWPRFYTTYSFKIAVTVKAYKAFGLFWYVHVQVT